VNHEFYSTRQQPLANKESSLSRSSHFLYHNGVATVRKVHTKMGHKIRGHAWRPPDPLVGRGDIRYLYCGLFPLRTLVSVPSPTTVRLKSSTDLDRHRHNRQSTMKNLAQLYLLAALTVVPSLAADPSPHAPSDADLLPMSVPKPKFEGFSPGIVPAVNPSRLGKRQNTCASANSYICPTVNKCCPIGYDCIGSGTNVACCPIGKICDPSITYCPAGETDCTNIIGFSGCCPTATHKCAVQGGTPGCERLGSSGGGGSGSSTSLCDPGTFLCADGSGCCPNGTTCVPGAPLCRRPGGLSISNSISIPAPTPMTSKAATSDITTSLFTPIPPRPTSTIADPEPTSPPKTKNENPSSSAEAVETGSRSSTAGPPKVTSTSTGSGNALRPGGWLGGFGVMFSFVFFHL